LSQIKFENVLYGLNRDESIAKNCITLSLIPDEKITFMRFENGGGAGIASLKGQYLASGLS
jgi:hypothetical protein